MGDRWGWMAFVCSCELKAMVPALLLCVALAPAIGDRVATVQHRYPTLPAYTAGQHAAWQRASAIARDATPSARASVLAMLAAPVTKTFLRQFRGTLSDGTPLFDLSGEELLTRFEDELETAEVLHNFGAHTALCGVDISLGSAPAFPQFFNQWIIQAIGAVPADPGNNRYMEQAETSIWGYAPMRDISSPDLATSIDRPVYGAINLYRNSVGNLQCGPVAAVFSNQYIGDRAVTFPVDSGLFGCGGCGSPCASRLAAPASNGNWSECFHCDDCAPGSNLPVGTRTRLLHMVLPFVSYYNASMEVAKVGSRYYRHYNLARLVTRMLSRTTYTALDSAIGLSWFENMWGYFEVC